jgi:hypothetical protein
LTSASTLARGAVVAVAAIACGVCIPSSARATDEGWGINGTFVTSSNGAWAKVNERYEDQPSVRSDWTITTQCTSPVDCAGTVTSDQGWTAPIYTRTGIWWIKRTVPNWRFCEDGTPIVGLQVYRFYPVGPDGYPTGSSFEYTGEDITTGPSGSCGRNQWPQIRMPFYMKEA